MADWKAPLVICGVNINAIKEPEPLHKLLQQCQDFDDKNKIFARLMSIMPGGSGSHRLLPLVCAELGSLQRGRRRASTGTLGVAQQRALELGSFLANLNNNLEREARPDTVADSARPGNRLSPELLAEVASVLGRVKECLNLSTEQQALGGSAGRTARLVDLIDRLRSELEAAASHWHPPIPRRSPFKRVRRPHTTSITRAELSEIRRSLQEARQQLHQQKISVIRDQVNPAFGESSLPPINGTHMARPFVGRLKTGQQHTTPVNAGGNTPASVTSVRPSPAQRSVDRMAPRPPPRHSRAHTIGGSDEDFAIIRESLKSAISPAPTTSHACQMMPVSRENDGYASRARTMQESHEEPDVIVLQTAKVHESKPQFAQSNKTEVHHRSDEKHPIILTKQDSLRSPQPQKCSLTTMLAKQMTKDYLEDSANMSRTQVIENRLANHQKATSPVTGSTPVTCFSKTTPSNLKHSPTPEPHPNRETTEVPDPLQTPTQYTCSIVTQETQLSELPPPIPPKNAIPKQISPIPTDGSKPVWSRVSRQKLPQSIKTSPHPDYISKPPWARPSSSEIESQPQWNSRTQQEEYSQPENPVRPHGPTEIPQSTTLQQDSSPPSTVSATSAPSAGSHLPWTGSANRSSNRASSVSRIASTFNAGVESHTPPQRSRFEKTQSLYDHDHKDHTDGASPMQQRQLAMHRLQTAFVSDEVPQQRKALERSKSEEQIGQRGRSVMGAIRQEQFARLDRVSGERDMSKGIHHASTPFGKQYTSRIEPRQQILSSNPMLTNPSGQHFVPHLKSYPPPTEKDMFSGKNLLQRQASNNHHNQQLDKRNPNLRQDSTNSSLSCWHHVPSEIQNQAQVTTAGIHASSVSTDIMGTENGQLKEPSRPVWAKSGGSVRGRVKQQAANLDEAPTSEPFLPPPQAPSPRRHSSDTKPSAPSTEHGVPSHHFRSMSGTVCSNEHVGTKSNSSFPFKPLPGQIDHHASLEVRGQAAPTAGKPQPASLPPISPRLGSAHLAEPGVEPPSALSSPNPITSPAGLQRSGSVDMLRCGVSNKPFEAKMDAASAKAQKRRLQEFFQERDADREDEKLARSFEDLLDDLDEDDLAAVSPPGDGGKSGWPVQETGSLAMHALVKSATVGDLRSGGGFSLLERPQRRRAAAVGASRAAVSGERVSSSSERRGKVSDDTLDLVKRYFAKEGM